MSSIAPPRCPGARTSWPYWRSYNNQNPLLPPCRQCELQNGTEPPTMKPPGFKRDQAGQLLCPARIGPEMPKPEPYDVTKNYKGSVKT
ncbi:MAG: hypothetical protein GXY45_10240 [Ramlibacter sp.]|nr:hypothetical protein [Ramlibacter sp.]